MRDFPSGTVTFLFTDVEGSTRRWEQDSVAMRAAIERHFAILDEAIRANNGVRFKIIGDAVQAAFPTALDAVLAAVLPSAPGRPKTGVPSVQSASAWRCTPAPPHRTTATTSLPRSIASPGSWPPAPVVRFC